MGGCLTLPMNSNGQSDCNKIEKIYVNIGTVQNKSFGKAEIKFNQTNPVFFTLFHQSPTGKNNQKYKEEYYDLNFEGDKYLLTKKYENLDFLSLLKEQADSLVSLRKCNAQYSLNATLYRDSIVYKISQCCSSSQQNVSYIEPYLPSARYNGNIKKLAELLEQNYIPIQHGIVGDSVYIFKGFVNDHPLNSLDNITLTEGIKCPFSEFISASLSKTGKSWLSMVQGGREVKSYVRIFVRLNSDKSITLDVAK